MPGSKLAGREPAEVTEHEYDDDGRLIRSVTTREAEWTDQDMAEVLALAEYRDSLCPCCGLPKRIVWGPERDVPPLIVSKWWCHAGRTMAVTQEQWKLGREITSQHNALRWSIDFAQG